MFRKHRLLLFLFDVSIMGVMYLLIAVICKSLKIVEKDQFSLVLWFGTTFSVLGAIGLKLKVNNLKPFVNYGEYDSLDRFSNWFMILVGIISPIIFVLYRD